MITEFKPYPEMKDSGVEWLGEVPEHWEVRRAKSLFQKIDRPIQEEDKVVTCFRDGVVTLRKNRRESGFTESLKEIGYQGIRAGDLVIHSMDAFAGAIGVADSNGKGSPVYSVCTPGPQANAYFYAYALREMAFNGWIQALAKGIRERSSDFRYTDFAVQLVPLPSIPEQTAIARFLDRATDCIDRHIRAKEKLTTLLEEQKKAIIHQAIIGQIDVRTGKPYPAYKDSGMEWLGKVPVHWNILPGRACFSKKKQANIGLQEKTVLSLSYGQIVVKPPEKLHGLVPSSFETYQIIGPHDIVIRSTDLQNDQNSLRFGISKHRGIITSAYLCLSTRECVSPEYGYLVLHSYDLMKIYYGLGSGLRQNLGWADLKYLPCPVPPIDEQTAIVRYLDETSSKIDDASSRAQRETELLGEHRERLISDVVTGKLDVCEAATRLPQEADKPASIDDADDLTDGKEEHGDIESSISEISQ